MMFVALIRRGADSFTVGTRGFTHCAPDPTPLLLQGIAARNGKAKIAIGVAKEARLKKTPARDCWTFSFRDSAYALCNARRAK
jgi:hypothetical protein